jgi:hypothetical protein
VIIRVTVSASVVVEFLCIDCLVTTVTGYLPVLPLKGVAGPGMIEVLHSLDLVKGSL